MLNQIQREKQRVNEPGRQAVVFAGDEGEDVDVLVLVGGGGIRAGDLASCRGDGDCEEGQFS